MPDTVFTKNDIDIAWRVIDGEAVIIPLEQNDSGDRMILLNSTATRIWELINGKNKNSAVVKKITDEYEVSAQEAESEVKKIIAYLSKRKIIKKC